MSTVCNFVLLGYDEAKLCPNTKCIAEIDKTLMEVFQNQKPHSKPNEKALQAKFDRPSRRVPISWSSLAHLSYFGAFSCLQKYVLTKVRDLSYGYMEGLWSAPRLHSGTIAVSSTMKALIFYFGQTISHS